MPRRKEPFTVPSPCLSASVANNQENTMNAHKIWRRLTTTRYARALEAELGVERTVVALQDAEINRQAAEIARLRDENRAMLNSILGIAGVPPLPASLDDLAAVQASLHVSAPLSSTGNPACATSNTQQNRASPAANTIAGDFCTAGVSPAPLHSNSSSPVARTATSSQSRPRANSAPHVAAPMRRRSWPQINRLLEFASAQKEQPAANPLPPAHQ
jgi:hypothetical protein